MYTNNDIQRMIDVTRNNTDVRHAIQSKFSIRDEIALNDVLLDGSYERFDRYNSDICEQFIRAYEEVVG